MEQGLDSFNFKFLIYEKIYAPCISSGSPTRCFTKGTKFAFGGKKFLDLFICLLWFVFSIVFRPCVESLDATTYIYDKNLFHSCSVFMLMVPLVITCKLDFLIIDFFICRSHIYLLQRLNLSC